MKNIRTGYRKNEKIKAEEGQNENGRGRGMNLNPRRVIEFRPKVTCKASQNFQKSIRFDIGKHFDRP